MSISPGLQLSNVPTASGGIARAAYAWAVEAHVPVEPLLRRANLTVQQAQDPHARMPVRDQIEFLNLAAGELDEEFLGLRLAEKIDLRQLGLVYYVAASSDTLGDALQRVARYSSVLNEGVQIEYRAGKYAVLTFTYFGVARRNDRHQIEFFVTSLLRFCRELGGVALQPQSVKLAHHRANMPAEFGALFGKRVVFDSRIDEVVLPGPTAHTLLVNADPYLNALLLGYCEEALAKRRRKSTTWRLKAENAIAPLLPHGQARIGEIAARLGVGRRTLARRLASEGLTFLKVLDNLRCDLAKRYLQERDLPVSEIAWLLGYQEPSAFTHAFKRWTGRPPKRHLRRRGDLQPAHTPRKA
jgi:AraC-like DNA-binding protein